MIETHGQCYHSQFSFINGLNFNSSLNIMCLVLQRKFSPRALMKNSLEEHIMF
uniref:Uncharacterized protein n=1 Tax=Arundo donax TaxID=35708 RepID=A0A0A9EBV5_ARUDO